MAGTGGKLGLRVMPKSIDQRQRYRRRRSRQTKGAGDEGARPSLRNDFGHSTGITAAQEDALPLRTLFPRFADAATRATDSLAQI